MDPSPSTTLALLLTCESLLFAAFSITLAFGTGSLARTAVADLARKLAIAVSGILTVLGAGAVFAWADVFARSTSPSGLVSWCSAIAIVVGAVSQPLLAWTIIYAMQRQ